MNKRRRMAKRARLLLALSAPTWEEALKYCYENKYPERIIKWYIDEYQPFSDYEEFVLKSPENKFI